MTHWCIDRGLDVTRSPDSDADRIIQGKRVEIKLSTLWANGRYTFQQIRDQNYDYLLCLGISPFEVHAWIMRKEDIPFNTLQHQHGGSRGRDTWWLSINPKLVEPWLEPFGGTLKKVLVVLKRL